MDHIIDMLIDLFFVNKGPKWMQRLSKFVLLFSIAAVAWWLFS